MARNTPSGKKEKAKVLQRWVASKIAELTGLPVGKDEDIESRQMGESGTDVRLSVEARREFPFSVECKNKETWDVPSSIRQAKSNTYSGTDWLLVFKKNYENPVVILDAEVFFDLLEKLRRLRRTRSK